jgi:hypothetical protein
MRHTVDAGTPVIIEILAGPILRDRRIEHTRSSTRRLVRFGDRTGRDERSTSPASPSMSHRFHHFDPVALEIPISAAT